MKAIETDSVTGENTCIIVLAPTGIKYTAQCGGIGCTHPEAEGWVFAFGDFAEDFNDCSYGCSYLGLESFADERAKLAQDFDTYAAAELVHNMLKIKFDYSRIDQLQEGWIPILLNGFLDETKFENAQAILYNGNCD